MIGRVTVLLLLSLVLSLTWSGGLCVSEEVEAGAVQAQPDLTGEL